MEQKLKIGYIDENESEVKKYSRLLRKYDFEVIGYNFVKGMELEDLMAQVYNSDVDLIMIDYRLNETNIVGFNGEKVEKEIYDKKPRFPYVIFTNKVDQAEPHIEDWKTIFDKGIFASENSKDIDRFATILCKSIEQYKNYIQEKKELISDLLKKEEKTGLNAVERNILLSIQKELQNLDKTKTKEVPEQLSSVEQLDELSNVRKEAEEFLQSLIEKAKKK